MSDRTIRITDDGGKTLVGDLLPESMFYFNPDTGLWEWAEPQGFPAGSLIDGDPIASEDYADAGDAATLVTANAYTDSELADHVAAADPHTGYVLESAYTAADVLAKLLTVDGAGSGADADLLDGQHGSYYSNAANLTGDLPPAVLPAIGWRLNKNGSDQTSVGTGDTLITWSAADAWARVDNVTFTDANDSVTVSEDGWYIIVARLLYAVVADQNVLVVTLYINGSAVELHSAVASGNGNQPAAGAWIVPLSAGDVLTIYGRNATSADTIVGAESGTYWMGAYLGPLT